MAEMAGDDTHAQPDWGGHNGGLAACHPLADARRASDSAGQLGNACGGCGGCGHDGLRLGGGGDD